MSFASMVEFVSCSCLLRNNLDSSSIVNPHNWEAEYLCPWPSVCAIGGNMKKPRHVWRVVLI